LRNTIPSVVRTLELLLPPERELRLRAAGEHIGIGDEHADASPGAQRGEIPPTHFGGFDRDTSTAMVRVDPVAAQGDNSNLPIFALNGRPTTTGERGRSPGGVDDEPRVKDDGFLPNVHLDDPTSLLPVCPDQAPRRKNRDPQIPSEMPLRVIGAEPGDVVCALDPRGEGATYTGLESGLVDCAGLIA
jgi:hypothetical protein